MRVRPLPSFLVGSFSLLACSAKEPAPAAADVGATDAETSTTEVASPRLKPPTGDPLSWPVDAVGPFNVGHRVLDITYTTKTGASRAIPVDIWYPTLDIEGDNPSYKALFRDKDVLEEASLAAPIERPGLPKGYPVHLYSHGSSGFGGTSSEMAHWFVTHGWVYVGPNHVGNTLGDPEGKKAVSMYFLRATDLTATLDALEKLPTSDPLSGKLSTKRVLLSGHSFGAFSTWLAGGATVDVKKLQAACDAGEFLNPCKPEEVAVFGKDLSDPRIVALIPMAGGAFEWIGDYDAPKKPTLLMSGSLDVSGGPIFDRVSKLDLTWLEFEGGCHQLFALGSCKNFDEKLGFQLTNTWAFAFGRRYVLGDSSERTTKIVSGVDSLSPKITLKPQGHPHPPGRWHMKRLALTMVVTSLAVGCKKDDAVATGPVPTGPVGTAIATPSGASRLTKSQYTAAIHELFGNEVVVTPALEPDVALDGFDSIGARSGTVSARGVEQYETSAFAIANQIVADPKLLGRIMTCKPAAPDDVSCAKTVVSTLGLRVFRRPLEAAEIDKFVKLLTTSGKSLGSFEKGLVFGLAALLQSPHFLYRPAVGEPDPEHPGQKRYSNYEFATRLSMFLWNSIPDETLLGAAKSGELGNVAGVAKQVDRMLASPKAREGLRNFVSEWFRLADLDLLQKDSKLFTTYTADLGAMAREETLRFFEDIVFERDADAREMMTSRRTFVNPKLASMYQLPAPSASGFAAIELPEEGERRGLLGQISFLALYAHPTSSSATLRGKFVREKLLCRVIPPPPVGLNTALPEPTDKAKTLRERVQIHFTTPGCASCHQLMDPIGLGLEPFDGIGRARVKENGSLIDASGTLDGAEFSGPKSLGQVIFDHPKFPRCVVRKVFQYATGTTPEDPQEANITALTERFAATGYRMKALLASVATSPAFRAFGAPL